MEAAVDTRELRAFNKALAHYLRWNRREQGPLIEARAARLRFAIYRGFRAIAPTAEKIEQEAAALGYRIKRGLNRDGTRRTVGQELAARRKSIRFLSVSWLYRAWKRSREGQNTQAAAVSRAKERIGQAIVRTAKGQSHPSVLLESFLEGVQVQNNQRGIIEDALRGEVADMKAYVRRKQLEKLRALTRG
jgi:hypothetical protein